MIIVGILLNFIDYINLDYGISVLTESNIPIPKLWALNLQKNLYQLRVSLLYKRLFFQFDNRWRCERFMPKRNNFCLFFSYELNISKSWVICWKNSILQIQYSFLWDLSHILWSHSKALAEEWLILYMYIYDFWFKIIQFLTQNHVFVLS